MFLPFVFLLNGCVGLSESRKLNINVPNVQDFNLFETYLRKIKKTSEDLYIARVIVKAGLENY